MLELRGVSYRYPGYRNPAVRDVELAIAAGEVVGLVGPNDGGKSTVCLVASGLAPASIGGTLSGEVRIDGVTTNGLVPAELAGLVGIVFANPSSQLSGIAGTVFEEVAFGPVNLGLAVDETVARTRTALRSIGIEGLADRRPDHLSGGETQLVAIAAMLAMRPRFLILDEPVSELDPWGRGRVAAALTAVAASGTGLLIAEHDREFLISLQARLVQVDGGRLGAAT